MAFLGRAKKEDLKILAEELREEVPPDYRVVDLKKQILESKEYDEEFVKELLATVISERIKREEDQKRREEKEEQKRKEEQEFEREMRRIEATSRSQVRNPEQEGRMTITRPKIELHNLMQKFNAKESDISLYLVLFERQARKAQVNRSDWVCQLMSLLPYDITQLIAREPEERAEDYDHVKSLLLKRFKLSPEKFRQMFVKHQKNSDQSWRDFDYELRNYFKEWVSGLGITTFEQLSDLMVTDQLKRRVPNEAREHFIDEWSLISSSSVLAEKMDDYESVRGNIRKKAPVNGQKESNMQRWRMNFPTEVNEKCEDFTGSRNRFQKKTDVQRNQRSDDQFEKRKRLQCFECGSYNHLRPQCPKIWKNKESYPETVNRIGRTIEDKWLTPYITMGQVNGYQMPILRDSGASIDIICRKHITPEMLTGENVWVQQPLDVAPTCLPLARVELIGDFGHISTKAAVIRNELDQGRYLLGNRTAALLAEMKNDKNFILYQVNAVKTRGQTRLQKKTDIPDVCKDKLEQRVEDSRILLTAKDVEAEMSEEDHRLLPSNVDEEKNDQILSLLKVNPEDFVTAQNQSTNLKPLFELVSKKSHDDSLTESYILKNKFLVKRKFDKTGVERHLLVVPEKYRECLKILCHEGTSAHLGVTKTKDRLARHFYWPKCYKELEDYVRTCDRCQKAGKPNDKKKAPLKIVPVIQEVFSKINVDACGPLPTTPTGKKYIITAMCLSSKYPDAVAVADIGSVSVVDALLQIFSRMGFPKELQCDQGTSFMSSLTTKFLERFGIKVSHSSVHHPQSNPIERFHRTIKRILRVLCLEAAPDWEQHIHSALFALRTVTHESTGFTPAELVHGKNLRTPLTLLYENWMEPKEEESSVIEYVLTLINRLKRCQELAVNKMKETQVKRKTWYDKNAVKREFKEGDLVLVLATFRPNKLAVQWTGPGTIQSKISDTNYLVDIPGKKEKSQIYHINMLKPYYKRPELINFLDFGEVTSQSDSEIEFPSVETDPNIFNFAEIVKESKLEERLKSHQIQQLQDLLCKYLKSFSNEPGKTHLVEHDIELISDKTIRAKPYRMSPRQNGILKAEIKKMLKCNVIEIGESDYTSPMILVEVPGKDPRPCIDYRRLNEVVRTQYYPLPNIDQRVETVASARYITLLDLAKGYWQIPLSSKAQRLATFVTSFGTYRPLRLPFGLKNAPYFFSKMMAELLQGCEEFAVPYLDDMAIFSNNWENHIKHLECVLCRIQNANLHIKPSKCRFAQDHVKYLGHIVGQGTRTPAELKVKAIRDFPTPSTKTEVRAFLGLAGYYRQYIPMFSATAAPLTETLKGRTKKGEILWNAQCESAFQELKDKLSSQPVLYAPDFNLEFLLQSDASDYGMGIVLSQIDEKEEEHPVLYLSKKFSEVEKRYCTTEKECAAIVYAVKKLHCYLDGQTKFKIQTDHNPLVWLGTNASSNPRLMRWALALQPYNYEVVHRRGTLHKNADSLSRVRWPD